MNDLTYAKKLLLENNNESNQKMVKLQINMYIQEDEMENLKKLVSVIKKKDRTTTIKSICEGALRSSGIFEEIE